MPQWLFRRRWLGICVAVSAGVLVLFAACGDDDEGGGEEPGARRKAAAPTSAVQGGRVEDRRSLWTSPAHCRSFGPEHEYAARLAVQHINDAGGVNGGGVEIVIGDSQTAAEHAETEAQRMVDVEGVARHRGGALGSSVSLAVAESVTAPAKILQISPASTSPSLTGADDDDFLFRTPISDAAQGVVLAQMVIGDLGLRHVCTMYVNNAYGQGLAEQFAESFTKREEQ